MGKVSGLLFAFILFLIAFNTSFAEEKVKLSDKEEVAVQNFVAALLDEPIGVVLKSELLPPYTEYHTDFVEEDLNNLRNRASELINVPQNITTGEELDYIRSKEKFNVSFIFLKDYNRRKWDPQISCGSWYIRDQEYKTGMSILGLQIGTWHHPNEGKDKCPHKEGTDHPGTIGVKGEYTLALDYKGTSEIQLAKGVWSYDCKYTEGSKSGSVPCKIELVSWEGQYGKMPVSTASSKPTTKQVALGLVGLGAVIAGGIYLFRRFKR